MKENTIQHVSDTALWVALYRAEESERPDALFHDPLARKLMGDRGEKIARNMNETSAYTKQNVVIRTHIIDLFIKKLIVSGVDTFINLGAGLDTRPYRLELPPSLRWIEVDYPHLIEMKNERLRDEKTRVRLERVPLDLANRDERKLLFARIASESKRVAVLTEGVLPYLFEADVATLAEDLFEQKTFEFWIVDDMAKETYKYLRDPKRMKKMANAPFRFFPEDRFEFFKKLGWVIDEIKYIQGTSTELGRPSPLPWWAHVLAPLMSTSTRERISKMSGYAILRRSN